VCFHACSVNQFTGRFDDPLVRRNLGQVAGFSNHLRQYLEWCLSLTGRFAVRTRDLESGRTCRSRFHTARAICILCEILADNLGVGDQAYVHTHRRSTDPTCSPKADLAELIGPGAEQLALQLVAPLTRPVVGRTADEKQHVIVRVPAVGAVRDLQEPDVVPDAVRRAEPVCAFAAAPGDGLDQAPPGATDLIEQARQLCAVPVLRRERRQEHGATLAAPVLDRCLDLGLAAVVDLLRAHRAGPHRTAGLDTGDAGAGAGLAGCAAETELQALAVAEPHTGPDPVEPGGRPEGAQCVVAATDAVPVACRPPVQPQRPHGRL